MPAYSSSSSNKKKLSLTIRLCSSIYYLSLHIDYQTYTFLLTISHSPNLSLSLAYVSRILFALIGKWAEDIARTHVTKYTIHKSPTMIMIAVRYLASFKRKIKFQSKWIKVERTLFDMPLSNRLKAMVPGHFRKHWCCSTMMRILYPNIGHCTLRTHTHTHTPAQFRIGNNICSIYVDIEAW